MPARPRRFFATLPGISKKDWEGVSASILEGFDKMLTVTKFGLPPEPRRSLACTDIIENVMGTVRRVSRNVKYWRSPSMALRWAGAAMQEAAKGFKRLKAYKQLPLLQAALAVRKARTTSSNAHLAGSLPRDRLKISSACPCFSSVRARPFRSGDTPPHAERSTARGFRRRPQSRFG